MAARSVDVFGREDPRFELIDESVTIAAAATELTPVSAGFWRCVSPAT